MNQTQLTQLTPCVPSSSHPQIVAHPYFDTVIVVMCLASSVILALDDANLKRDSFKALVLRNMDASFTAIFGVEVGYEWLTCFALVLCWYPELQNARGAGA